MFKKRQAVTNIFVNKYVNILELFTIVRS